MTKEEAIEYLKSFIELNKHFSNIEHQTAVMLAISTLHQLGEFGYRYFKSEFE